VENWGILGYLRPDLVLVYEKPDARTLRLIRPGSHSERGF
jgi:mRNA-degrading endonuclease YafQ of YafQ-DinJ toxin-antitoxin module